MNGTNQVILLKDYYGISLILFFLIDTGFLLVLLKLLFLNYLEAKVGRHVVIKPKVNIKYPWNVSLGNYVWIGEEVWLDSLGKITIGNNVCISQGVYLFTGNHNYKRNSFDLIVDNINIKDGVWIGAKSIVCPGVTCNESAILSVGSIATKDLESFSIYQGNPRKIYT